MIVVIDAGVWISAFQFGGTPRAALQVAAAETQIAWCEQIIHEIRKALLEKMNWSVAAVESSISSYEPACLLVSVSDSVKNICRDPKDDMVLECALLASASLIVSGDKDLLTLHEFRGIRIVTPREYLDLPR
ncbi:MAG: putative toxin-antitoxin system toxin component, PIN family [Bryobacterales bacterium]|nr:putative toxin-antitoxin system toxin component, PIN family [Bryobacterales bacterium]